MISHNKLSRHFGERGRRHLPKHRVIVLQNPDQNGHGGFVISLVVHERQRVVRVERRFPGVQFFERGQRRGLAASRVPEPMAKALLALEIDAPE